MLARAMQERGVPVFVDLNVAGKFYKLNLLGIPAGYGAFCTRGYSDRINYLEFEYEIAKSIASGNELLFVIYGGGKICREFAMDNGCVYVNPVVDIKQKTKSAQKKITGSIAFIEEEFDTHRILEKATKSIVNSQIENFNKKLLNHE